MLIATQTGYATILFNERRPGPAREVHPSAPASVQAPSVSLGAPPPPVVTFAFTEAEEPKQSTEDKGEAELPMG